MPIQISGAPRTPISAPALLSPDLAAPPSAPNSLDGMELNTRPSHLLKPTTHTVAALAKPFAVSSRARSEAQTVDIRSLLSTRPVSNGIEQKRGLHQWIPGNDVTYYSHHNDPSANNAGMIDWLKDTEFFTPDAIANVIENPSANSKKPVSFKPMPTNRSATQRVELNIYCMCTTAEFT